LNLSSLIDSFSIEQKITDQAPEELMERPEWECVNGGLAADVHSFSAPGAAERKLEI
jgi:hypothetical protein